MKFLLLALFSLSAFSFTPIYKETENFKVKVSKKYRDQNHPRFCKFETFLSKDKKSIKLKMGVVGSPVDYFGWNMQIDLNELPLKKGFVKRFKTPGVTGMMLSYDGTSLKFEKMEDEAVWNNLYLFEVQIDPSLESPKSLTAVMQGFDKDIFGRFRKHVKSTCEF